MQNTTSGIVAVLNDLMFLVKIQQAAKQAGLEVQFAKTQEEALALAALRPSLMILDLNCSAVRPLDLISILKSKEETKTVQLLGYVSHVQTDVRQAAEQRGCDTVVARSAFVQNLATHLEAIKR